MNLRGRTVQPSLKPKPEAKTKPCRRSERNKGSSKPDIKSPKKSTKAAPLKETRPRPKKRYSKKPQNKKDESEVVSVPPVVYTGIKDIMEIVDRGGDEESKLTREASVIYECKVCNEFFRSMSTYVKHKQTECTLLFSMKFKNADNWNPFMSKEVFFLCPSSDESSDDVSDHEDAVPT